MRFCGYLLIFALVACLTLSCVKKGLENIVNQVWIVQKEKGGIVEEFLQEQGHNLVIRGLNNPCYQETA